MASTNPVNQSVKLTKLVVDKAPRPDAGQLILRDTELKGFGLRVTAGGAKSFILEKRIKGRVRRLTLGRYPGITAEQARKEAQKLLGHIITGHDPMAERAQARIQGITLAQAFDDFLKTRANLKERTRYDYLRLMKVAFPDWARKPLASITKDLVAKRHSELGDNRGKAYANLAMRFLRALLNFARARYEDPSGHPILFENPVARLTHTHAWYRIDRRQTVIKPHQLPSWYEAVLDLKGGRLKFKGRPITLSSNAGQVVPDEPPPNVNTAETVGDYLLLLLFTGLRRQEAARLRWEDIDLPGRTLTVRDTKNREPLTLPLPDFVHELLTARADRKINEYVFPGTGREGYLIEPRVAVEAVIEASGVNFTLHDLRRTFITAAESLDIPAYALKRLVNHKMNGDVTAGYIVMDIERLRRPMQQVADYFLRAFNARPAATVVSIAAGG